MLVDTGVARSFDRGGQGPAAETGLAPLRWTSLSYRVPTGPSRQRVAIWRGLQRVRAINLRLGTWAIRCGEHGPMEIGGIVRAIAVAGGRHTLVDVADTTPASAALQDHLRQTCAHMWDGFFNDVDRATDLVAAREDAGALVEAVDHLRQDFVDLRRQDLDFGDTGLRAHRRLTTLTASVVTAPDDGARARGTIPTPALPSGVERSGFDLSIDARARQDGSVTYVATVVPLMSVVCELALVDFESTVYLPDAGRPALEHGAFVFTCRPDERDAALANLRNLLDLFARSAV